MVAARACCLLFVCADGVLQDGTTQACLCHELMHCRDLSRGESVRKWSHKARDEYFRLPQVNPPQRAVVDQRWCNVNCASAPCCTGQSPRACRMAPGCVTNRLADHKRCAEVELLRKVITENIWDNESYDTTMLVQLHKVTATA